MVDRGAGRHPPAERLTAEVRPLGADGVEERHQVLHVVADLQRVAGLVGVAVAEHVDGPGGEVLGVRLEVADVGLGMTARPVQQHQRRLARIARVQVPGANTADVEVAL